MLKSLMTAAAVVALLASPALADPNGGVDDQNPAQSRNPNDDRSGPGASGPGGGASNNLFEVPTFSPAEQHLVVAGDNVAPGSGNWGGGPGNSGPGDKNGTNDKSKDGGQTPNDDK